MYRYVTQNMLKHLILFLLHIYKVLEMLYVTVSSKIIVNVELKGFNKQSHAAQHTTHNHNQAHSKQRMIRTQKHDMLPQHKS